MTGSAPLTAVVRRRVVAIAFCDLADSTRMLSVLGEAGTNELRRDLFAALRRVISEAGGTEVKNLGDGVMAAFPALENAVAAARCMHVAAARVGTRWRGVRVVLRVGCSAGEATEEQGDWFGRPVIEASRLCDVAQPGEILVAAHSLPDGDRNPSCEVAIGLRGLDAPLAVVRIEGDYVATPCWVPPPELDAAWASPMIGREAEFADLMDAVAALRRGNGSFVTLTGEPGSGRTRLLAEVCTVAAAAGSFTLGASVDAVAPPLDALGQIVRWLLGGVSEDELSGLTDGDLDGLSSLLITGDVWWPSLHERTRRPDTAVLAVERLMSATARLRPVVVALDDVDQAHPVLTEAIARLARLTTRSPMLLVVAGPPAMAALPDAPAARVLALQPLTDDALRQVMRGHGIDIDKEIPALRTETAGMPGRVVELARSLPAAAGPTLAARVHEAALRTCPYKGLLAYEPEDADRFVGREAEVASVFDRLAEAPLVAVVGVSGAGKSSLLRAGVVPALVERALAEGRSGRVPVITPGCAPLDALMAAIDPTSDAVAVDQLEELFTLCDVPADRARFAERLAELAEDGCPVVVAIRSDHFGSLGDHRLLASHVERGTLLLGAPSPQDMRRMVSEPAERLGCQVEPGFVDVLLSDIGDEPGSLPLMSHVLLETWRRRKGTTLTATAYRAAGGARGAIARSADQVYESLTEKQRAVARTVLLRLTEVHDDDVSRRTVPLSDLTDVPGFAVGDVEAVVDQLVHARLVTVSGDGRATLAHEALLRHWPTFMSWIDRDLENLKLARHLSVAAAEWESLGRPDSELLRGVRLDAIRDWAGQSDTRLTTRETSYVAASTAAADATARRDRRTRTRLRRLLATTAVGALLALLSSGLAFTQRERALDRARDADRQAELALTRQLAAEAVATATDSPARALNLAVEAYSRMPDLHSSRSAVLSALLSQPSFLGYLGPPIGGIGGPVTGNAAGLVAFPTSEAIWVWDLAAGERVARVPVVTGELSLRSLALTDDGRLVVLQGGRLRQWNARTARELGDVSVAPVTSGALDVDDGGRRAVVTNGTEVLVADLVTRDVVAGPLSIEGPPIGGPKATAAISGDGRTVAVLRGAGPFTVEHRSADDLARLRGSDALPASYDPEILDVDRQGIRTVLISRSGPSLVVSPGTGTREIGHPNAWNGGFSRTEQEEHLVIVDDDESLLVSTSDWAVRGRVPMGGVFVESAVAGGRLVLGGSPPAAWSIDGRGLLWDTPVDAGGGTPTYISADGRFLSTWRTEGHAVSSVIDLSEGTRGPDLPGDVSFLNGGLRRWSDFEAREVHVIDRDGRDVTPVFRIPPPGVTWDAVDPSGRWVAWGAAGDGYDGGYVADIGSGEIVVRVPMSLTAAAAVGGDVNYEFPDFNPRGGSVMFTGHGRLTITSLPAGRRLLDVSEPGYAAGFSPDGRSVLVLRSGAVVIRDAVTGEVVGGPFPDELGTIQWAQQSSSGSYVAVASEARLQLFDTRSGRRIGPELPALPGSFGMFQGDDALLFGTPDGVISLPLDPARWARTACRAAGSNLSPAEWRLYLGDEPYRATCPGLRRRS